MANKKSKPQKKCTNRYRDIADVVIKESSVGKEGLAKYKMIDADGESADASKS